MLESLTILFDPPIIVAVYARKIMHLEDHLHSADCKLGEDRGRIESCENGMAPS